MDFLKIFNEIVKLSRPLASPESFAKSMDDKFEDLDLDSMDFIMIYVYFGSIYDVTDEIIRDCKATTPAELKEYLESHAKKIPSTTEEALEDVK
jgi:acyl carrier protein